MFVLKSTYNKLEKESVLKIVELEKQIRRFNRKYANLAIEIQFLLMYYVKHESDLVRKDIDQNSSLNYALDLARIIASDYFIDVEECLDLSNYLLSSVTRECYGNSKQGKV